MMTRGDTTASCLCCSGGGNAIGYADGPIAVRYPRGSSPSADGSPRPKIELGRALTVIVSPVVRHYADADEARVTGLMRWCRDAEDEVRERRSLAQRAARTIPAFEDARLRFRFLPRGAHVEQVHEEVRAERARARREHAMRHMPGIAI